MPKMEFTRAKISAGIISKMVGFSGENLKTKFEEWAS
jgi:hypothetical protein